MLLCILFYLFIFFFEISDELVEHYLGKSGFQCLDIRLEAIFPSCSLFSIESLFYVFVYLPRLVSKKTKDFCYFIFSIFIYF